MEFRTKLKLTSSQHTITHHHQLVVMGSCFAQEIGNRLVNSLFACELNPFGVMYNPLSIEQGIRHLLTNKLFSADDLILHNGLYHSFMHHSSFSKNDAESCLNQLNERMQIASRVIQAANCLLITFGTSYVYRFKATNEIVSNCHKIPNNQFTRELITVDQIVNCYQSLIETIQVTRPDLKIIFTVSPIRHLQDGLHHNQISKSTLLLAIHALQARYPETTSYFPAYELLMDDLRDYRFYATDMVHPSAQAVEYIWSHFQQTMFDKPTRAICAEWAAIQTALNHLPFNPQSAEYLLFRRQIEERKKQLIIRMQQLETG